MPVAPAIEPTLAFVVREAVTNVIRHAGASQCSIALIGNGREIVLSISDDGRGGSDEEGAGLRGMRARVSSVGGRLRRDADNGTRLTITVPVSPARAGAA
jgi:signal transduction histidine kinase